MKLKKWQILIVLLGIGAYLLWWTEKEQGQPIERHQHNLKLLVEKVDSTSGWMYSIFDGNVLLVRQQILPVLKGHHEIPSREAASQLGNIVMNKIQNKKMPVITAEELDQVISFDLEKDCIH